jgi:hypothetical protein
MLNGIYLRSNVLHAHFGIAPTCTEGTHCGKLNYHDKRPQCSAAFVARTTFTVVTVSQMRSAHTTLFGEATSQQAFWSRNKRGRNNAVRRTS